MDYRNKDTVMVASGRDWLDCCIQIWKVSLHKTSLYYYINYARTKWVMRIIITFCGSKKWNFALHFCIHMCKISEINVEILSNIQLLTRVHKRLHCIFFLINMQREKIFCIIVLFYSNIFLRCCFSFNSVVSQLESESLN